VLLTTERRAAVDALLADLGLTPQQVRGVPGAQDQQPSRLGNHWQQGSS
jgi:hypothetical protein